jgi:hypothetical protein
VHARLVSKEVGLLQHNRQQVLKTNLVCNMHVLAATYHAVHESHERPKGQLFFHHDRIDWSQQIRHALYIT